MDIFKLVGALGVVLISIGIITKQRKNQDIFSGTEIITSKGKKIYEAKYVGGLIRSH